MPPYGLPRLSVPARTHDAIIGLVRIPLQRAGLLPVHNAASKPPVQRGLVYHQGVLYVVAAVAHHGDGGVLTGGDLVELDEVDGPGPDEGDLRVAQEVEEGVDAVPLVVGDGAHGLLAHGALVGVAGRLVVVREWNEPGAHPQDGERLDLQVGGRAVDVGLVQRDVAVVLLVHIQVLHGSHLHQLLKLHPPREHLHVLVPHLGAPPLHHDVRPAHSTAVRGDVHALLGVVGADGDKLVHPPGPAQETERSYQVLVVLHHPEDVPVQEHQVDRRGAVLLSGEKMDVLHAQVEGESLDRFLVLLRGDVGHEGQVLHQSAPFPLGGVRGAHHPPLGGLEGAGAAHLPRLLELAREAGHHPKDGDEGEAGEDLGDARPLHLEALQRPVAARDGIGEPVGDLVLAHVADNVKLGCPLLGDGLVGDPFELRVELLEEVLEEEGEELPRQLEPLVTIVVPVVHLSPVRLRLNHPPHHQRQEEGLHAEVPVGHGDMGQHHARQDVAGFLGLGTGFPPGVHLPHLGANVLQRLGLGEDAERGALLERRGEEGEDRILAPHHLHDLLVRDDAHPFHRHDDRDVLRERVVLQVQLPVLDRQVGTTLALMGGAGHRATDGSFPVLLDDDAVLGELFLDQNHLLHPFHDEVAARIERALVQLGHLEVGFTRQRAVGGSEHNGHPTDRQPFSDHPLGPARVLDIHGDGGAVRDVPEPALVRGDLSRDVEGLFDVWAADRDV